MRKTSILMVVLPLLVLSGAGLINNDAYQASAMSRTAPVISSDIPPIDTRPHARTESATFALG